ncbi:MAG: hypothetical protein WCR55_06305 [Lentisphaerota bacterium]
MSLIWIILSLHFFYYVPFLLLFLAFIRVTAGKITMYSSIVFVIALALLDFYILYANFNYGFIVYYIAVSYLSALITTLILWFCGKLDITIWLLFSIIFSPISLPFALLFVYLTTPKTSAA